MGSSKVGLLNSDCLDAMRKMPDNCIDAIVTDPPYGLSFMGKDWDHGVPGVEFWKEALRVAKPGAHLLSFGGTRTFHRIACAIEDAGWEVRDCMMWLYGSGFPKSMDISKAIDKKLGALRQVVGYSSNGVGSASDKMNHGRCDRTGHATGDGKHYDITEPSSSEAKKWSGWGTCLKPAYEPIIMARKPVEGTIVDNVLKYGTGGINIDECRVPYEAGGSAATNPLVRELRGCKNNHGADTGSSWRITGEEGKVGHANMQGRFPANIIHDGSDEVVELFPNTGTSAGGGRHTKGVGENQQGNAFGSYSGGQPQYSIGYGDSGSAARFFYCAKASKKERGEGNVHPTVKPIALMEYLVKLVAPENAIVLDPFMGSGTTGVAAVNLGRGFVGIEKEKEYFDIAERRIENAEKKDKTNEEPTGKDGEAE